LYSVALPSEINKLPEVVHILERSVHSSFSPNFCRCST